MKKEIFAISLLAFILCVSIINASYLNNLTDKTAELISLSADDDSTASIESAEGLWKAYDSYLCVVLHHSDIDSVEEAIYKVKLCLVAGDKTGAALAAEAAVERLNDIAHFEWPHIGNIF